MKATIVIIIIIIIIIIIGVLKPQSLINFFILRKYSALRIYILKMVS